MNRLNTLISNMLNSIPLPSLRGRGRGWGFTDPDSPQIPGIHLSVQT